MTVADAFVKMLVLFMATWGAISSTAIGGGGGHMNSRPYTIDPSSALSPDRLERTFRGEHFEVGSICPLVPPSLSIRLLQRPARDGARQPWCQTARVERGQATAHVGHTSTHARGRRRRAWGEDVDVVFCSTSRKSSSPHYAGLCDDDLGWWLATLVAERG